MRTVILTVPPSTVVPPPAVVPPTMPEVAPVPEPTPVAAPERPFVMKRPEPPRKPPVPEPMFYDGEDPWSEIPNLFRDHEPSSAPPTRRRPEAVKATRELRNETLELEVPDFLSPYPQPVQPQPQPQPQQRDGVPEQQPWNDSPQEQTVLGGVLGPDLWRRCQQDWSSSHCAELARVARALDGLAPAATTSLKSTAGAGLRWLGMTSDRDELANEVAAAIGRPDDVSESNAARTVRLYGAALCASLNLPLRRCSCYRDLQRDVSPELLELGLAGLREPLI